MMPRFSPVEMEWRRLVQLAQERPIYQPRDPNRPPPWDRLAARLTAASSLDGAMQKLLGELLRGAERAARRNERCPIVDWLSYMVAGWCSPPRILPAEVLRRFRRPDAQCLQRCTHCDVNLPASGSKYAWVFCPSCGSDSDWVWDNPPAVEICNQHHTVPHPVVPEANRTCSEDPERQPPKVYHVNSGGRVIRASHD